MRGFIGIILIGLLIGVTTIEGSTRVQPRAEGFCKAMSGIPVSSEVLGAMITPAVLISASGVLVLSTSNRVGRTVDLSERSTFRPLPTGRRFSPLEYSHSPDSRQIYVSQKIDAVWHDRSHAYCINKKRKAVDLMKINIVFLSALFLIGATLWARVAVQGIEQALLATAADYGLNGISAWRKLLAPNID